MADRADASMETSAASRFSADRRMLPNLRRDVEDGLPDSPPPHTYRIANALGWFSVGLGFMEILAPRTVSRWLGLGKNHDSLIPWMGAREVATGIGILSSASPGPWLWLRVAGDAIDLSLLGAALHSEEVEPECLAAGAAAVAGVTACDLYCAARHGLHS